MAKKSEKPQGMNTAGDAGGHRKGEIMTLVLLAGRTGEYAGPRRVIAEDGGSVSDGGAGRSV